MQFDSVPVEERMAQAEKGGRKGTWEAAPVHVQSQGEDRGQWGRKARIFYEI